MHPLVCFFAVLEKVHAQQLVTEKAGNNSFSLIAGNNIAANFVDDKDYFAVKKSASLL
jgi:hypothetical protein